MVRRQAVAHVRHILAVSERRACQVLGQPRSTQQYQPLEDGEELQLRRHLHTLARRYPRYGYRRITAVLKTEGRHVNAKRIHRLWHLEGLKVPKKRRRLKRRHAHTHITAMHPNHIWSYDFIHDQTQDGRPFRFLSIMDEFTHECLALRAARRFTALDVASIVGEILQERGAPQFLRSDNGPEFAAKAIREYLASHTIQTAYIAPGCPWENGFVESFHSRLRDEFLNREVLASMLETHVLAEQYRLTYNHHRPHSTLGYVAPAVFARRHGVQTEEKLHLEYLQN